MILCVTWLPCIFCQFSSSSTRIGQTKSKIQVSPTRVRKRTNHPVYVQGISTQNLGLNESHSEKTRATLAAEEEEDETLVVTVTDPAERAVVVAGDDDGKTGGVKVEATITF